MAQGATVYVFEVELADADREVYQALNLRVARHPSETVEYLLTRVIAYCLEFTEGIAFSKGGISGVDEPSISVRDLTGVLRAWIDIGSPDAARLHRAAKAAPRVAVYAHRDARSLAGKLSRERIHRLEQLELYALDEDWLAQLAAQLTRRVVFALTVTAQHLYLTLNGATSSCAIERLALVPTGS